ncbi:peptide transporter [Silvibacterium dinghuense]|nr:peptide transporter [Silvibacterium dinghuense]
MTFSTSRRSLLLAFLVLLLSSVSLAQETEAAQAITAELRANQNAQALTDADKVLKASPSDCRILTLRGIALLRMGQQGEARASFDRALKFCPQSLPALEGAAQIDYAAHAPDAAALLERILAQRPDDPTTHAMLGALDFQHGNCAAAITHFAKSSALIEHSEEAQREYAACLFTEDQPQQAIELFQQLATQDASETNLVTLAYVQWKSKDNAAALRTLAALLASTDAGSRVYSLAAQIAEDSNDTPHAVQWLRTAILKDPHDPENYLLFATLSFNHASYQVGIDMVNTGIQQIPDSARLFLARGVLEVQLSKIDAAVSDFQKAHALDPKLSFAQDAMGMVHSQQHDAAGSLAIFRAQAAAHPGDPLLQYLYAEALSEQDQTSGEENLKLAIAAVKKSLELEPGYQSARDLYCKLLLQTENYNEVIHQAEIALKNDPTDQSALYQQMQAERRLGNKEAVTAMVARLNDLKQKEKAAQVRYQLSDTQPQNSTP